MPHSPAYADTVQDGHAGTPARFNDRREQPGPASTPTNTSPLCVFEKERAPKIAAASGKTRTIHTRKSQFTDRPRRRNGNAPLSPTPLAIPTPHRYSWRFRNTKAKVAELADAQDSGSCGVTPVGVQVPPFASFLAKATKGRSQITQPASGSNQPKLQRRLVPPFAYSSRPTCPPKPHGEGGSLGEGRSSSASASLRHPKDPLLLRPLVSPQKPRR